MAPVRPLNHHLAGPPDAPLLVLGPSLGTSMAVWEQQLPELARDFRVLRFDLPGHGGSATGLLRDPGPGATTLADLAALVLDLVDLVDHHGHGPFHYAGISLSGAIGAHLAAHHPGRVASLALVCSSAHFGPADPWRERAALVRREGVRPLLATSPSRWFADTATAGTPFGRALLRSLAETDPAGYAACCDALAVCDLGPRLPLITAPTLVVGGSRDEATPLHHAAELTEGIPGARSTVIDAGHLAVEQPRALLEALGKHLGSGVQLPG